MQSSVHAAAIKNFEKTLKYHSIQLEALLKERQQANSDKQDIEKTLKDQSLEL